MNKKPFQAMAHRRVVSDDAGGQEPRWQVLLAALAMGGLYLALPKNLVLQPSWLPTRIDPRWLPLAAIIGLELPLYLTFSRGHHRHNQLLGYVLLGVITAFMVVSLSLLIHSLPTINSDAVAARRLLHSAAALWLTNVLVFASWYWRLDGGGPHARDMRAFHCDGAFLFPQMSLDKDQRAEMGEADWSPQFIDYLFLAFNTSTALSPADTAVLSRWAKVLMMVQALISLSVLALLAARAVNIL